MEFFDKTGKAVVPAVVVDALVPDDKGRWFNEGLAPEQFRG